MSRPTTDELIALARATRAETAERVRAARYARAVWREGEFVRHTRDAIERDAVWREAQWHYRRPVVGRVVGQTAGTNGKVAGSETGETGERPS